jgi:hypothetical protein
MPRLIDGKTPPVGAGQVSMDWGYWIGESQPVAIKVYLTRLSTIVVHLTQANDIHRNLVRSRRATRGHLFHFSLRSRCTAMLAGLRMLSQTEHGPDR